LLAYNGDSVSDTNYYFGGYVDTLSKLSELGFTEYEARVYMTLLADHPATGYQLSKVAGVPRSMVYEALGRLKVRGAVLETSNERAKLYRPLPPEVLLDHLEQAQRRLIDHLRPELETLYTTREENRVWSIRGEQSIISYAAQMVRGAEHELYLVLDDLGLDALQEEVGEASRRGVSVNTVLTGQGRLAVGQVVYHPPLESELHELAGTLLVVADGQEVLAANADLDMAATITRNRNLVLIARQFVWMELFAQRIFSRLGRDLLDRLDPADRRIFESA
jgi:Cd2+/Zn2+-exporting ATPase